MSCRTRPRNISRISPGRNSCGRGSPTVTSCLSKCARHYGDQHAIRHQNIVKVCKTVWRSACGQTPQYRLQLHAPAQFSGILQMTSRSWTSLSSRTDFCNTFSRVREQAKLPPLHTISRSFTCHCLGGSLVNSRLKFL